LPCSVDGQPGCVNDNGQGATQSDGAADGKGDGVGTRSVVGIVNCLAERATAAVVQVADDEFGCHRLFSPLLIILLLIIVRISIA
jgi:hypothetical protein